MNALIVTARDKFYHHCEQFFRSRLIPVQISSFEEREYTEKLESMQPDILLLDAVSGEEVAMRAITQLREVPLATAPGVFVRTKVRRTSWESHFLHQGVMYVFDEFFGDLHMVDNICKIYRLHRRRGAEEEIPEYLNKKLRMCCLLEKHKGFRCIFDAVVEIYRDPQLRSLTGQVYPLIARQHGGNASAITVEKNIRDAISNAWENGGAATIPDFLGRRPGRAPTNSQFIMGVVERLREHILLSSLDPDHAEYPDHTAYALR